ncbi:hypothetical protein [Dactylosporangium sp. NPDC051541]|uniref:hypothetical protein n=1 Tax=Dactylosporangium sp. NPDC051541 TaxID=3363977 RepID=UPI00378F1845
MTSKRTSRSARIRLRVLTGTADLAAPAVRAWAVTPHEAMAGPVAGWLDRLAAALDRSELEAVAE